MHTVTAQPLFSLSLTFLAVSLLLYSVIFVHSEINLIFDNL